MAPLNLRNLKQPKTLLLLGGAFGFVALVAWCVWNCRLVLDRTASAPAGAVAAVSLRQPLPEKVAKALPQDLASALGVSSAYSTRLSTGAIEWHPLSGQGHWRIVRRDVGAVGFAVSNGVSEPFSAVFSENGLALRVGRGFRGLDFDSNLARSRLIKAFPKQSYLYISDTKPSEDAAGGAAPVLGEIMKTLKGRMELVMSKEGDSPLQPFIIIVTPGQSPPDFKALDSAIAQSVGKLDPSNLDIILPDRSGSKEQRSSVSDVKIKSKKLSNGDLRRFIGPSGKVEINYFLNHDGSLWISNHLEILAGFSVIQDDSSLNFPLCTGPSDRFTAITHPKAESATGTLPEWINPWSKPFNTVIFSLKQAETGLFTLCGYL